MNTKADVFTRARPRLFGLAYRMLGCRMDAEDVVQDAWLKFSRNRSDPLEDPEAWLVTVVTRLGIDRLRYLRSRREEYYGPWLPEPVAATESRTAEETMALATDLSMGFLLTLERLSPDERAAFLLREVFDYSYAEMSRILGRSEAANRQVVSRARQRVRDGRPRFAVAPQDHNRVVERFTEALMQQDSEAFSALLAEDIRWISDGGGKAVAATRVVCGVRAASRLAMGLVRQWQDQARVSMGMVNGQQGIIIAIAGRVSAVIALESDGQRVLSIYSVVNPDKLATFHSSTKTDPEKGIS